jgi:hypothetical protein
MVFAADGSERGIADRMVGDISEFDELLTFNFNRLFR